MLLRHSVPVWLGLPIASLEIKTLTVARVLTLVPLVRSGSMTWDEQEYAFICPSPAAKLALNLAYHLLIHLNLVLPLIARLKMSRTIATLRL